MADAERELQIIPPQNKGDLATTSIQNALLVRPLNAVYVSSLLLGWSCQLTLFLGQEDGHANQPQSDRPSEAQPQESAS